ncbi:tyrosine-protein phosphatase vhp-1-like isoform X2 [Anneissia japonica]|uniref:tyrosine-protein phosphatase vhp-1-like isoform X2 n=1 Tax=Anneissia japonica TaxID=1529436 RepID=UPI0014257AAA|nr:tyrosine-protein phosphatase vhp-1-like isoform X2 [Anneissia japonica]
MCLNTSPVGNVKGGFVRFKASFPNLCVSRDSSQCSTLAPLSQPCMPVANVGPTKILSFLHLGSQQDVMNQDLMHVNGINYVLNISKTCPAPKYVPEANFCRIPIHDNYCEKILPFLQEAMAFIDKARSANGAVIIHCYAGISRSPTVAIAYIMQHLNMTSEEAYRYVKDKRPTISPNFNFLGQLLEHEKLLNQQRKATAAKSPHSTAASTGSQRNNNDQSKSSVAMPASPDPSERPWTSKRTKVTACQSLPLPVRGSDLKKPLKRSPTKTLERPKGLELKKVTEMGPIFLNKPCMKKGVRMHALSPIKTPDDPLFQVGIMTSNLSVNSPEVRNCNPFVEACKKMATDVPKPSKPSGKSPSLSRKREREASWTDTTMEMAEKALQATQEKENVENPKSSAYSQITIGVLPSAPSDEQKETEFVKHDGSKGGKLRIGQGKLASLKLAIPTNQVTVQSKTPVSGTILSTPSTTTESPSNLYFKRQLSEQSASSDTSSGVLCNSSSSASLESQSVLGSGQSNISSIDSGLTPSSSGVMSPEEEASRLQLSHSQDVIRSQTQQTEINPFRFPHKSKDLSPSPPRPHKEPLSRQRHRDRDTSMETRQIHRDHLQKVPESHLSNSKKSLESYSSESSGTDSPRRSGSYERLLDSDVVDSWCSRTRNFAPLKSASCEEISSCAREAVAEIVVRERYERVPTYERIQNYDCEMDDDIDSRSLSSQRSLSSSCEMIEVS